MAQQCRRESADCGWAPAMAADKAHAGEQSRRESADSTWAPVMAADKAHAGGRPRGNSTEGGPSRPIAAGEPKGTHDTQWEGTEVTCSPGNVGEEAPTADRLRPEAAECPLSLPTPTGEPRPGHQPRLANTSSPERQSCDGPEDPPAQNPSLWSALRGPDTPGTADVKKITPDGGFNAFSADRRATSARRAAQGGGFTHLLAALGLAERPAISGELMPLPGTFKATSVKPIGLSGGPPLQSTSGKRTALGGGLLIMPARKRPWVSPDGDQRGVAVHAQPPQSNQSGVGFHAQPHVGNQRGLAVHAQPPEGEKRGIALHAEPPHGNQRRGGAHKQPPYGNQLGVAVHAQQHGPPVFPPLSGDACGSPPWPPNPRPVSGDGGGIQGGPSIFPRVSGDAGGVPAWGPVLGRRTASGPADAFQHENPERGGNGSSRVRATAPLELTLSDGSDADECEPASCDAGEFPLRPPVFPKVSDRWVADEGQAAGSDAGGNPPRPPVFPRVTGHGSEMPVGPAVLPPLSGDVNGVRAPARPLMLQSMSGAGGGNPARPPVFARVSGDGGGGGCAFSERAHGLPRVGSDEGEGPARRTFLGKRRASGRPGLAENFPHLNPAHACENSRRIRAPEPVEVIELSDGSEEDELPPTAREGSGIPAAVRARPPGSGTASGAEPAVSLAHFILSVIAYDIPPMSTRTFIEVIVILGSLRY